MPIVTSAIIHIHLWFLHRIATSDDRGQATAEYALVVLGAALVAVLLIAWATAGGGAGRIGRLFDAVLDAVLDRVR